MAKSFKNLPAEELKRRYYSDIGYLFEVEARRANIEVDGKDTPYMHTFSNGQDKSQERGWKCIHSDNNEFINCLEEAIEFLPTKNKQNKFLDVGCGIGAKMFLANRIFELQADGIELRKALFDSADRILKGSSKYGSIYRAQVYNADALKFKDYDKYDIIYFYWPIAEPKLEVKLENLIAKKAKIGTIVMGFSSILFGRGYELNEIKNQKRIKTMLSEIDQNWKKINNYCWQKVSDSKPVTLEVKDLVRFTLDI